MSDAAKKALEALEAGAPSMKEADLAYIAGYADGAASKEEDAKARDSDTTEEEQ